MADDYTASNAATIKVASDEITSDASNAHADIIVIKASNDGTRGMLAKAEDTAAVAGDFGVPIVVVRRDTAASGVNATGDYDMLTVDALAQLRTRPYLFPGAGGTFWSASINTSTSGDNTLYTPTAGKQAFVLNYQVIGDDAMTASVDVIWKMAATSKTGPMPVQAFSGFNEAGTVDAPLFGGAVNDAVILNLSAAKLVTGRVAGVEF